MGALDALLSEDFVPLYPINFVQLKGKMLYRAADKKGALSAKYALPITSALCNDEPFAEVAAAWNEFGITVQVTVDGAFGDAQYPRIEEGDSVEVFIDTRDIKTSGYNTRFCHHFFFLPKSVDGHQQGELTRFRTEDAHELCDPQELKVTALSKKAWQLFVPNHCMVGYDSEQFDRIGFSYRVNRMRGSAQHFSVSGEEYALEQQPALWSSLKLSRG